MKLLKPKLVIFDWDNTLINSWDKLHHCLNYTMQILNMPAWSLSEVKRTMHKSSRDFFPQIFSDNWLKAKELFYEAYQLDSAAPVIPLKNAHLVLKILKDLGIKISIVSNKTGKYLRNEIKQLNWENYFEHIFGAYDHEEDKPSAIPVIKILNDLKIESGLHNWFIGDTIVDMQCAKNSGCYPILFGQQENGSPHPKDFDIVHTHIQDHNELINLIRSFNKI